MSTDWYEAEQEEAYSEFVDSLAAELYEEHRQRAIEAFVSDRLASYYLEHPNISEQALVFFKKAKFYREADPVASLLFSCTTTEVLLKTVILKPIVYGLVHTESLAELIASGLVRKVGIDRLKGLVFQILDNQIEFPNGIKNYCRDGSRTPLLVEHANIQEVRNAILHQAKPCACDASDLSFEVARAFVNITHLLLNSIGLKFSKRGVIVREAE
ncbi:hypothetical protein [Candidatus Accumulibacter sp. ACC003]|uniref:hypothetical protein n=1 Tax=Candidatus Accumulibacter sp. ACC003 TaxID=2823334 RepID=UPI0025C46D9E|nr:hypothetical protein [Candidatus Accumulibacter sp. ACC003]